MPTMEGRCCKWRKRPREAETPMSETPEDGVSPADTETLLAELAAAREACQQRIELLAQTSHEVRTPVTSIIGFAELLLDTGLDERQRDHVQTILQSAQTLMAMVNDLLDFTRLEAAQLKLAQEPMDLRECIEDVFHWVSPQAASRSLELICQVAPNLPGRSLGDPRRMRQVLLNLVSNAVKFSHGGNVIVSAVPSPQAPETVQVTVRDPGPGVPAAARSHLFQPQPEAPGNGDANWEGRGSGLGLWIARRLVEHMGGRIGYRQRPGGGSEFWFELAMEAAGEAAPSRIAGSRIGLDISDPEAHRALEWALMSLGVEVAAPASGDADAWVLGLPAGLLGRPEGARRLAEMTRSHRSPLVVLTAAGNSHRQWLKRHGATGSLPCPIRRKGLERVLARVLGLGERRTPCRSPHRDALPQAQVLVVEDNAINAKLVRALLESRGIDVTTAGDAREALREARNRRFDLVLLDIHLPGLDGFETARRLRALNTLPADCAIIGLTADVLASRRHAQAPRDLDECLCKPLDLDRFWAVVEDRLQRRLAPGVAAALADLDLAQMLEQELPVRRETLHSALAKGSLRDAAEVAHGLAGSAAYCQALDLCQAAQRLEQELLRRPPRFDAALAALEQSIDSWLAQRRTPRSGAQALEP